MSLVLCGMTTPLRCGYCSKIAVGHIYSLRGQVYCTHCTSQFVSCHECSLETMIKGHCLNCHYQLHRCQRCKLIFENGIIRHGTLICDKCVAETAKITPLLATTIAAAKKILSKDCYRPEICQNTCSCDMTY